MSKVVCPECGMEYQRIGQHWSSSTNHRPPLTQKQREVVTGLMMGDGTLGRSGENPFVKVCMITREYLEYLDDVFGVLGTGVSLGRTAAELAKANRKSGFDHDAIEENYHDQYLWQTRRHPELHEWNWYDTGSKVWPENIELTPTVLKHWYCGDGNWKNDRNHDYVRIGMTNEIDNTDKVSRYFSRAELPEPSSYGSNSARFTVGASHDLWDYMGEPLPGFSYKWPEKYH